MSNKKANNKFVFGRTVIISSIVLALLLLGVQLIFSVLYDASTKLSGILSKGLAFVVCWWVAAAAVRAIYNIRKQHIKSIVLAATGLFIGLFGFLLKELLVLITTAFKGGTVGIKMPEAVIEVASYAGIGLVAGLFSLVAIKKRK